MKSAVEFLLQKYKSQNTLLFADDWEQAKSIEINVKETKLKILLMKFKTKKMTPKIESLLLLAKFDDGIVRQVITDKTDQMSIINYLVYTHNAVKVLEGEVGIDWECKFNLNKND